MRVITVIIISISLTASHTMPTGLQLEKQLFQYSNFTTLDQELKQDKSNISFFCMIAAARAYKVWIIFDLGKLKSIRVVTYKTTERL